LLSSVRRAEVVAGERVCGIRERRLPVWELEAAWFVAGRMGSSVVGLEGRLELEDGLAFAAAVGLGLALDGLESSSRFLCRTIST
jgi:hypothetical protein